MEQVRFFDAENSALASVAAPFLKISGFLPERGKQYSVIPGLCDVHVHFREPGFSYKETIQSGSAAGIRRFAQCQISVPRLIRRST